MSRWICDKTCEVKFRNERVREFREITHIKDTDCQDGYATKLAKAKLELKE